MKTRMLVAIFALASAVCMAAETETPSRLRYTLPAGWTQGNDATTLLPPGGNVGVTLTPSTAFAGSAEQWMAQSWDDIAREMKLVSGPAPGTQGAFLTRLGIFQQANGSTVWLVLHTLVQDGRGEALVYFAGDETQFRAHMPALSAMVRAITVANTQTVTMTKVPTPSAAVAGSIANEKPPATSNQNPTAPGRIPMLSDYDFVPPEQWQVQNKPDHILLTQVPDETGCTIQILPPQPSSGDLERDARAIFETMYRGWNHQKTGEQQYVLSRGVLPKGLEYCMLEAPMSATTADGRYHLEEGAALVVKTGSHFAIIAVRHRSLLAHIDCQRKYETWRRFFNSFTVKNVAVAESREADVAKRIVGVWSLTESGASSEYVFAANGHYARVGALGTSSTTRDLNFEYLHLTTYAFAGDGTYSAAGGVLNLQPLGGRNAEQLRFRFEQANHGGTGWRDRLYLLKKDRSGENEVCFERRTQR